MLLSFLYVFAQQKPFFSVRIAKKMIFSKEESMFYVKHCPMGRSDFSVKGLMVIYVELIERLPRQSRCFT